MVYGETDEFGYNIIKDPVHIHDFHATILHLMGLDHTRLTFRFGGRDMRLTDVHGNVVQAALADLAGQGTTLQIGLNLTAGKDDGSGLVGDSLLHPNRFGADSDGLLDKGGYFFTALKEENEIDWRRDGGEIGVGGFA